MKRTYTLSKEGRKNIQAGAKKRFPTKEAKKAFSEQGTAARLKFLEEYRAWKEGNSGIKPDNEGDNLQSIDNDR